MKVYSAKGVVRIIELHAVHIDEIHKDNVKWKEPNEQIYLQCQNLSPEQWLPLQSSD